MRICVLTAALGFLIVGAAISAEPCKAPGVCTEAATYGSANQCSRCGAHCCCEKYCKVVCEMKEVKKHVWVVKCSEFCTTLPRLCHDGCCNCEACKAGRPCVGEQPCEGQCGKKCNPCAVEYNKDYVPPTCGKMRDKKTLEKKEVVCKVPSYKCVVVYCCPQCIGAEKALPSTPPPAKPEPPVPAPMPGNTTQEAPMPPAVSTSYTK